MALERAGIGLPSAFIWGSELNKDFKSSLLSQLRCFGQLSHSPTAYIPNSKKPAQHIHFPELALPRPLCH